MSKLNVKLELLKKTVSELETQLRAAQAIKDSMVGSSDENLTMEFIIQMNKVSGLIKGVLNEANYLGGDVDRETQTVQVGAPNFDKIMEALGAPKSAKNYGGGFGNGGNGGFGGGMDN